MPGLVIALTSDVIRAVLTMVGLATRWAAPFMVLNVGVAWSMVHHSSVDELVSAPEVDVVAVTVKVPHHYELVSRVLWPWYRSTEPRIG